MARITKEVYDSNLSLFTFKTLRDILDIRKESTLFSLVKKLINAGVLLKLERDKYLLNVAKISDFALANFIYEPSYISFESALNFHGVLSQFPYEISSATTKKPIRKKAQNKIFVYSHIKKELFWGYEKIENFLVASPEKAILDQLYLVSKGYKSIDLDEYDFSRIKISKLKEHIKKYPQTIQFKKAIKLLEKYL